MLSPLPSRVWRGWADVAFARGYGSLEALYQQGSPDSASSIRDACWKRLGDADLTSFLGAVGNIFFYLR